ncbi:MAG: glycosyltransferase [Candidatus Saccharibacteria bacterium]|nr:glycosyltransferase [Candidatus Saccharibacteria bacterium]
MKIVISTDIYYPMINGVAVFSRNLAAGLKKRGHKVMVLAPSIDGEFKIEKDEEYGFTVVRLKSMKIHVYPDQINKVPEAKDFLGVKLPKIYYKNGLNVSLNCYSTIKKILDDFQPDIIHDQTPGPVALAVFRYAKKRDIPLVSTDHAYPDNLTQQLKLPHIAKKPINSMMNKYFVSFLKRSEYATMPTEQAVADLIPQKRKPFKVPVEALSNGIDLSRFAKGRANKEIYEEYGIPKNKPIVLYVGRVDPEKSLDVLMDAYIKAHEKVPDAHLVVVGDGTARPKLEAQIAKAGLSDQAHFLGRVVGDNLPQLYRTGTVFAITSKTETQSIVLMEAMASGLPCVAVDAGAIHELVKTNKNGYLCQADDSDEVAKSLVKILSDKDRQAKMSDESIKRAAKHDISHTLTRMEEIYNIVLDNREKEL